MSKEDWALMRIGVQLDNPRLNDRAWLIHKTSIFCKTVALPLLSIRNEQLPPAPDKITRTLWIPDRDIEDTTNRAIIKRFADLKGTVPSQIIQRYIIDPVIRDLEIQYVTKLL